MKVTHIYFPFAFTDSGDRVDIRLVDGTVSKGSDLVLNNGVYSVSFASSDSECVSGVCPVR